jgi:predicted secreted Zn-dependent protease
VQKAHATAEPKKRRARKAKQEQPSLPQAGPMDAHQPDLATLQQTVGNQAVLRWIGGGVVQTEEGQQAPKKEPGPAKYDMGEPVKDAKEMFYPIDAARLSDVLDKFKFKDKNGNPLAAETTWELNNTFPIAKKAKTWEADPITWKYSNKVELPEWTGFSTASEAEKQEWARFIKKTREHEQGHVDRVKQYVEKEMPEVYKKASTATKPALQKQLKKKTAEVGDKLKEISDKYDDDTSHGATQGAMLKPSAEAKP